jgi:hypothetical protein
MPGRSRVELNHREIFVAPFLFLSSEDESKLLKSIIIFILEIGNRLDWIILSSSEDGSLYPLTMIFYEKK